MALEQLGIHLPKKIPTHANMNLDHNSHDMPLKTQPSISRGLKKAFPIYSWESPEAEGRQQALLHAISFARVLSIHRMVKVLDPISSGYLETTEFSGESVTAQLVGYHPMYWKVASLILGQGTKKKKDKIQKYGYSTSHISSTQ